MTHNPNKAVLVYQGGIANVFSVESFNMDPFGRDAKRLIQADFRTCEAFARGMAAAGVKVASTFCNMAGDVIGQPWNTHLDLAPFHDDFHPVWSKVAA